MFDVWDKHGDVRVVVEPSVASAWRTGLEQRGHLVDVGTNSSQFGHAHMIDVRPDGMLFGRSDPRAIELRLDPPKRFPFRWIEAKARTRTNLRRPNRRRGWVRHR